MKEKIFFLIILIILLIINNFNKLSKQIENFENTKVKKVAVIIHGFAPRSFKYTHKSIKNNIINKLKEKYEVDTYHFTLLSRNNKISSSRQEEKDIRINNNDFKLLKCKKIVSEYQEDLIFDLKNVNCTEYKKKNMNTNFLRSLYGESQIIKKFPINNYDVCIIVTSDSFVLKPINFNEIEDSYISNCIYTTNYNKFRGIANGFYISTPKIINIICNRFKYFDNWCLNNSNKFKNAEEFLKYIIDKNKIYNKDSEMFYLKIRANGKSNQYIKFIDKFKISNSEEIKKKFL